MPLRSNRKSNSSETNLLDELRNSIRGDVDAIRLELKELEATLAQSQVEVNKLAQRNAAATVQIQQIQSQMESRPRSEIRSMYDSALDAQQRLFVMRGQLDKIQGDKAQLMRSLSLLEKISQALENIAAQSSASGGGVGVSDTLEMLIQTQEAERQRLARNMHDGPAQALSNFILQTEIAMRLFDRDQAKAKEELGALKNSASSTFQKVRGFIFELRPMMLDDLGLIPTLTRYIESVKAQSGLDIRFNSFGMEKRLESYLEVMIFRAVQELLSNAILYSQAAQVKVQIESAGGEVRLAVEDNGKGFDTNILDQVSGMGLKIISDRVEMLGGEINIDSVANQGTKVSFAIPAALAVR